MAQSLDQILTANSIAINTAYFNEMPGAKQRARRGFAGSRKVANGICQRAYSSDGKDYSKLWRGHLPIAQNSGQLDQPR